MTYPLLPLSPLPPEPPLAAVASLGLRKPWEPSEAFGSLESSDSGTLFPLASLSPLLALAPSHPEPHWASATSLGPQEAFGTFGSLRQPWVFNQTQGPCSPCPHCPHLLCIPTPPGISLGPQEAFGAFGSLGSVVRFRGLVPLAPSHPLSLPGTWGVFGNNQLPWGFSQTQGPCFPCSPSLPSPPFSPHIQHCIDSAAHIRRHVYGEGERTSHLVKVSLPDIIL